jgi:uncharacterized Tic20 family protein
MESSTPDPAERSAEPDVAAEPVAPQPEAVADAVAAEPETVAETVVPQPEPVAEPVVAEPVVTEPVVAEPAPVPSLSLDDTVAAEPSAPDLDAVASRAPAAASDAEQVNFDLWDSGSYASTLAQEGYGQQAQSGQAVPGAPATSQQPGPTPYAQPTGYPQSTPYAQPYAQAPYAPTAPYAQANPYAQQNPYAQANPYPEQNPYAQANPYPEQNPYAPVPYVAAQPGTLTPDEERTWASAAHWSALVASVVGLGFLGPLLVYLIQGPKSPWVKAQAAESLNFEITYIIAMLASLVGMLIIVGWVTIFVFPLVWLIFRILAAVATSQGRDYRYPVNIRMVK